MGSKLKVGDRVKVIKAEGRFLKVGEVCSILSISPCGTQVEVQSEDPSYGDGWWGTHPNKIELVEKYGGVSPDSVIFDGASGRALRALSEVPVDKLIEILDINPMFCSCEKPTLKRTSTAVYGVADDNNAYNICTTCKKEHK